MPKEKSYLEFRKEYLKGRKTPIIGVYSKFDSFFLGEIKWYRMWRKYAFFPECDSLFDVGCLSEIISYINTELK